MQPFFNSSVKLYLKFFFLSNIIYISALFQLQKAILIFLVLVNSNNAALCQWLEFVGNEWIIELYTL